MYKPDDKNIDRLSRDAAEHYHAPGKPAWDVLQQMLDKELPQEKEKKRRGFFFLFWLLLGLLVAGSGIWYGFKINHINKSTLTKNINTGQKVIAKQPEAVSKANPENNGSTPDGTIPGKKDAAAPLSITNKNDLIKGKTLTAGIKTVPAPQHVNAGNSTGNKEQPLTDASITKHIGSQKTNDNPVAAINNKHTLQIGNKIKNSNGTNAAAIVAKTDKKKNGYRKESNTGIEQNPISATGAANLTTKKNKYTSRKGRDKDISLTAGDNNTTPAEDSSAAGKDMAASTRQTNEQPVIAAVPDTASVTNMPAAIKTVDPAVKKDSALTAKANKKKPHSKNEKAILLGLLAGIDESTVKFKHGSPAGYNFGLTAGYQFSKHWSVYTGAIYTKKNYNLNGPDFHPPHPYFTLYVNLQNVGGYCKMWEIPLQARYTFNPGAKTAFFASAGLSSYFMTSQFYNYSWKNNMNQSMTGAWSTDSTFKHVFSILHLSAGFEKQLGKHMNWQIEPYAKIPLGGVGFGNIRLSSFGINLSVQYRHPIKR